MTVFKKVIPSNDIKHGSVVTFTNQAGESEISNATVSLNGIHHSGVIEDRNKAVRYYTGDSSTDGGGGGPTTVTCFTANPYDDGYWRTSTSYATHDPGASNIYGSPVGSDLEFIVGFENPS